MKKSKIKKYETEEQMEMKRFVFVLLGLIIIIIGIYFFTRAFVTKDLFKETSDVNYKEGTINYNVAIVGTLLNRPEKEYYVMAFSNEDNNANYYNVLVSEYMSKESALKVYYLDLDNELNKDYIAYDENPSNSFTSIQDLKLGNLTLIKIKDGKVTKFIINEDEIKKEFAITQK